MPPPHRRRLLFALSAPPPALALAPLLAMAFAFALTLLVATPPTCLAAALPYGEADDAQRAELRGGGEIAGKLAWSGGSPAAGVRIDLVAYPPGGEPIRLAEAETAADGGYRFAALAAKKAKFRIFLQSDPTQRTFYIFVPKDDAKVAYDYAFQPRVGDPAPPHVMPGLDGKPVDLADFRGKVVVIKFWAVWCGPCHAEIAEAARLAREKTAWRDRVAVMAVNCDVERKTLDAFIAEKKLEGLIHLHEPGKRLEGARARGFHIDALPMTFVVDARGIVRWRGEAAAGLEAVVDRLLEEKTP